MATAEGVSIYEAEVPVFLQDGNESYYLDESNLANANAKLDWVRDRARGGGRLLDVGANFGHFLSLAKEHYDAWGLEPSPFAARWARENLGVDIEVGTIEEAPSTLDGAFDIVTLWDVIEHVPDPETSLRRIAGLLSPGGLLLLSTPDASSSVARLLGTHWYYVDPVQHIALFGKHNLCDLLERVGFRVQGTRRFGHLYPVSYIEERLRYLYGRGLLRLPARVATLPLVPFRRRHLRLNLGDVVGIVARWEP